jgi:hypothetical protein
VLDLTDDERDKLKPEDEYLMQEWRVFEYLLRDMIYILIHQGVANEAFLKEWREVVEQHPSLGALVDQEKAGPRIKWTRKAFWYQHWPKEPGDQVQEGETYRHCPKGPGGLFPEEQTKNKKRKHDHTVSS